MRTYTYLFIRFTRYADVVIKSHHTLTLERRPYHKDVEGLVQLTERFLLIKLGKNNVSKSISQFCRILFIYTHLDLK